MPAGAAAVGAGRGGFRGGGLESGARRGNLRKAAGRMR